MDLTSWLVDVQYLVIIIRAGGVNISDEDGRLCTGVLDWMIAWTHNINVALVGLAHLASAQPKSSERPGLDPKAGRDFFSLMLCCLLILLAYILSLPSL